MRHESATTPDPTTPAASDNRRQTAPALHGAQLHRRLREILVAFTFALVCAGALVTANKASLADTHWPKFVGAEVDAQGNTVGQWTPARIFGSAACDTRTPTA